MIILLCKKKSMISKVEKKWLIIDAKDEILGRLSTQIARILIGKNKIDYTFNKDISDNLIIINSLQIDITGCKRHKKNYYKHTGFPGGIKKRSISNIFSSKEPERILRMAVIRMMPKESSLARKKIKKLYIYPNKEYHQFSQKPIFIKINKQ